MRFLLCSVQKLYRAFVCTRSAAALVDYLFRTFFLMETHLSHSRMAAHSRKPEPGNKLNFNIALIICPACASTPKHGDAKIMNKTQCKNVFLKIVTKKRNISCALSQIMIIINPNRTLKIIKDSTPQVIKQAAVNVGGGRKKVIKINLLRWFYFLLLFPGQKRFHAE